ncbi:MAG: hypothetical protein K940chlam6_00264 [Chlamydiae bacterium]|nr:hypothetical protein [Chlamydiota bacterium]
MRDVPSASMLIFSEMQYLLFSALNKQPYEEFETVA